MILPFSTQLKGKPTYFVEKIWRSLESHKLVGYEVWKKFIKQCELNNSIEYDYLCHTFGDSDKGKIHTIRADEKDRWKPGVLIDFFINCRQKNMFRFAPRLPVVSTQKVEIRWYNPDGAKFVRVSIDDQSFARVDFDKEIFVSGKMLELAQNDGFDSVEEFFEYFNEDYVGKIIHWTDKRY
jgi:hypothetical protein